jgi:glycosyltransferase involved in cell wall biosynthesis
MENYISRFLDSVLAQTYHPIELILVNDGSTDKSEQIIKSYISFLEEKGIFLKYIFKKNEGLGAAINTGLQVFTGKYLIWPDSDDFMSPSLVEKMVNFLINNPTYALVRTNVNLVIEKDRKLKKQGTIVSLKNKDRFKEDLFDITILEKSGSWLTPGSYMIRTADFLKINPSKNIYPCRRGQNWQMLLPVMFISKCGYIDEPLHNYLIRENSMDRTDKSIGDVLTRCDEHEDILLNTIQTITGLDMDKYTEIVKNKYHIRRLKITSSFKDKKLCKQYFTFCKNKGLIGVHDYLLYKFLIIIPYSNFGIKAYKKVKYFAKIILTGNQNS